MGEPVFAYWVVNVETGIHTHFLDCDFYEIGEIVEKDGVDYRIEDMALENFIGTEEINRLDELRHLYFL